MAFAHNAAGAGHAVVPHDLAGGIYALPKMVDETRASIAEPDARLCIIQGGRCAETHHIRNRWVGECLRESDEVVALPLPILFALHRQSYDHAEDVKINFGVIAVDIHHFRWCQHSIVEFLCLSSVTSRVGAGLNEQIV